MPLHTPVVFIFFRRPETTAKVFQAIRRARPRRLILVADGPRGHEDEDLCRQSRKVVDHIDWECEVTRSYSDTNLGVAKRVSTGITEAFKLVEEAIILEDDTLPSPFFFKFCENLLEQWRKDERVFHISGTNFIHDLCKDQQHTYYFNRHPAIWGWATWRRAWQHYDMQLHDWPRHKKDGLLQKNLHLHNAISEWEKTFDLHHENNDPWTWDYHWVYAAWSQGGRSISPHRNLVTNIGFGKGATHTGDGIAPNLPINQDFDEEIVHHPDSSLQEDLNLLLEKRLFQKHPNKLQRGLMKLRKLFHS